MAAVEDGQQLTHLTDVTPHPAVEEVAAAAPSDVAREIVACLVRQRQELRRRDADQAVLEANRLAIVYWQQRVSRGVVRRVPIQPPAESRPFDAAFP